MYLQAWVIDGTTVIGGFTLGQLVSYLFVTIVFQRILPRFDISVEVEKDIDEGALIGYLTKPIDYTGFRFFREVPRAVLFFSFGILTYFVGILLLNLVTPSILNILLFIPFFILAYAVSFFLFYTTALLTFWIGRHWWLRNFMVLFMIIAGGGLVPLTFFPPAIQFVLALMPFQYCYYIPATILQGYYAVTQLVEISLIGLFWLIVLYVLAKLVWHRGRRQYEGAGG